MNSKHYPYFKHERECIHCGQPIMFQPNECLYIHDWERWGDKLGLGGNHDNGYLCWETRYGNSATPPEGFHENREELAKEK